MNLTNTLWIIVSEYMKYVFSLKKNKNDFILNISERLAAINRIYIKMIQAISSDEQELDGDIKEKLTAYTDHVPFTDDDIYKDFMGILYEKGIALSDPQPINSGLVALIYKMHDKEGKQYAVKVKRKNIEARLKEGLNDLEYIVGALSKMPYLSKMNLQRNYEENKDLILEQLNFENEVKNIQTFERIFKNIDYAIVPHVYEEYTLTDSNIIVMDFIEGKTLTQLNEDLSKNKHAYCDLMAKIAVKCIFFNGIYHADLHQGNLLFLGDDLDLSDPNNKLQIALLDFGIIGHVSREEQNHFYTFMKAMVNHKFKEASEYLLTNVILPDDSYDDKPDDADDANADTRKNKKNNKNNKTIVTMLSYQDKENIVSGFMKIMEKIMVINKKATSQDIYELNKILFDYQLILPKYFCRTQLSFIITETLCNALAEDTSFIDIFNKYVDKI